MFKNLILPVILLATFIACNSAGNKEEEAASDTTAMNHDSMDHGAMHHDTTVAIAPVPDIPAGARVYFKNLKDGAKVSSPVKVEMATDVMAVDTANGIIKPGSGHHHILIDGPDFIPAGTVITKDSVHLHFGNAQKEATVTLAPGKHTLTLQFADALHRSYGQPLSSKISIEVKK